MSHSGDTDTVCPYRGTVEAIKIMKLPIKNPWRAWYSDKQVNGNLSSISNKVWIRRKNLKNYDV